MAAVRRKEGKLVARPQAPPPEPEPAAPLAVFVERRRLLDALEDDRRAHDKLAQTAHAKRHDDEETGAKSVTAYIQRLVERIEGGEV